MFDSSTAKPVKTGFDPSTAKPVTAQESLMDQAMAYPGKDVPIAKTLPGIVSQVADFANPFPVQMSGKFDPTTNPISMFEGKRQFLESAAKQVKKSVEGSEGNAVSKISELATKYLPSYLAEPISKMAAVGGTGASMVTNAVPFAPSDFAQIAGAGLLPVAAAEGLAGTGGMAESIANRWANAPKLIREGRLEKGQPTVGADVLSLPKDQVGDLAVNDKKKAFNAAKLAEQSLGDKIKNKIKEITIAGKAPAGTLAPDLSVGAPPVANGVSKYEIANKINEIAAGLDAPDAEKLMKFKEGWLEGKPDVMSFSQANAERVKLGQEIGKGFEKMSPDLSDKVTAQRQMWQALREKIGKISPEIDDMLNLQHKVMDIKTSVKPEAALGYTKTPSGWWDAVKAPIERNVGMADFVKNSLPNAAPMSALLAGGTKPGISQYLEERK